MKMTLIQNETIFVSGTDTDVGKTIASLGLLRAIQRQGRTAQGYKPVAAGLAKNDLLEHLRCNDDAYLLQHASSQILTYGQVNPYLFEQPIAPHIAAQKQGTELTARECVDAINDAMTPGSISVVEGAGGWLVPLNRHETFADIAKLLDAAVIVVVGLRLGCLNHALLTCEAIQSKGVQLAGWVANHTCSMASNELKIAKENIETLRHRIDAPMLAEIPYQKGLQSLFRSEERDVILDRLASFYRIKTP